MYDLTASALFGNYEGIDIVISHGFFPVTQAARKADEDNIPLFGWKEDRWLTICNNPTVNVSDVVNWFIDMRNKGFKIKEIGHDRKFICGCSTMLNNRRCITSNQRGSGESRNQRKTASCIICIRMHTNIACPMSMR